MIQRILIAAAMSAVSFSVASAATLSVSVVNPADPLATYNAFAPGSAKIVDEFAGAATPGGSGVPVNAAAQDRTAGNRITTAVGVFTGLGGAGSGTSVTGDATQIQVRSGNNAGRFNVLDAGGNFLDSNDTWGFSWEVDMGVVSPTDNLKGLSFFLTDAADAGANLRLSFGASATSTLTALDLVGAQKNGTVNFYGVTFGADVRYALLEFRTVDPKNLDLNRRNDGFAISGATAHVAPIPLPPAAALLLGAFGVLGAIRRRRSAA